MLSGPLYHGTSSPRLKGIIENGFVENTNTNKWLYAKGIYCVRDRPLVAHYFANWAVSLDEDQQPGALPVVIKIKLNEIARKRILDLTTDRGMAVFYNRYRLFKSAYDTWHDLYKEGFAIGTSAKNRLHNKIVSEYLDSIKKEKIKYGRFNWDCAVITLLTKENGYDLIVAAFQEGDSGAHDFFKYRYKNRYVPSYQGIRYLDGIIVCITNADVISSKIKWKDIISLKKENYPDGFFEKFCSLKPHPL
ncbi:MAG: hypothetical protein Q8O91_12365 [Candidatus Aminicenantes bacterium]|nr:hypothetical protein [Candidatus Aminicenantes bacterium]